MRPETLLLLGVLAVLVLVVSRLAFGRLRLVPWLQPLAATGTVFIFVGAIIGPQGADVFTTGILRQLDPLIVVGLGWIGFLYGSHFEWRLLRRHPTTVYAAALSTAVITFAVVTAAAWLLLAAWLAPALPWREHAAGAMILGICGAGTAPAGVFQLSPGRRLSARELNALRLFSALDDLPPVLLLGVLSALLPAPAAQRLPEAPWLWLLVALAT